MSTVHKVVNVKLLCKLFIGLYMYNQQTAVCITNRPFLANVSNILNQRFMQVYIRVYRHL